MKMLITAVGPIGRRAMLLIMAVVIYLLAMWLFSMFSRSLTIVEARSEKVAYQVSNPALAAFGVDGARLVPDGSENGTCVRGLVRPSFGATVIYQRLLDGALVVGIDAERDAGRFVSDKGKVTELGAFASVIFDEECGVAVQPRLPVWGPMRLGEIMRGQSDLDAGPSAALLDGDLTVYGRAVLGKSLYEVKTIRLPSGGSVEADTALAEGKRDWWGFVRSDGGSALSVSVTTDADGLQVVAPGPRSAPDTLSVSIPERALKDPSLVWIQLVFAVLAATTAFVSFFEHPDSEKNGPGSARGRK